jgi:hypothetical protein
LPLEGSENNNVYPASCILLTVEPQEHYEWSNKALGVAANRSTAFIPGAAAALSAASPRCAVGFSLQSLTHKNRRIN